MLRKAVLAGGLFCVALSGQPAFASSDPTADQVYQAARAGRLEEAQGMINKVLQDHPNSAKAHFIAAELFARQGLFNKAESELNAAERLAPGLPFENPQSVQDLKNRIGSPHGAAGQSPRPIDASAPASAFPWGTLLAGIGVILLIFVVIRVLSSRRSAYTPANAPLQNGQGYGPYGAGGAMGPTGGIGSGIMGGLATGAAVGVGMVAGEALAHHLLDGDHDVKPSAAAADTGDWGSPANDLGGRDFGMTDPSSWDDNASVADSGDGGDWT